MGTMMCRLGCRGFSSLASYWLIYILVAVMKYSEKSRRLEILLFHPTNLVAELLGFKRIRHHLHKVKGSV